jgi:hypothetical protein
VPVSSSEYDLEASQIARLTMDRAQSVGDVRQIVDRVLIGARLRRWLPPVRLLRR